MLISIKGLGTAFRTLSIIAWPGKESDDLSSSLPWFPIVGLVLGLILYAIARALMALPFTLWTSGIAFILVAAEVWLTRGLHLDGLADWADSIGGYFDREKRLAIMKDMNLGAFGVTALILVITAKWIAFERLISSGSAILIIPVFVISRSMMVELMSTLPSARSGKGMAGSFIEGSTSGHRIICHIFCVILSLILGPFGFALYVSAMIISGLFKKRCMKQFGGITGDLLGTANELIVMCLLFVCAFPGSSVLSYTGWA